MASRQCSSLEKAWFREASAENSRKTKRERGDKREGEGERNWGRNKQCTGMVGNHVCSGGNSHVSLSFPLSYYSSRH